MLSTMKDGHPLDANPLTGLADSCRYVSWAERVIVLCAAQEQSFVPSGF